MGKEKHIRKVEELFRKSPVVDFSSIARITKTKNYSKQLIRNLILKGKIKKLAKGYYTIYDNASLVIFCFKQAYLGLQDALSFHNLWEQEVIPIVITTGKVRTGLRKVLGANVLIRRLNRKYFFGFDYYKSRFYLPYSDIEKTFIDMVHFKENLSREILKEIKNKINMKKFNMYMKAYPKKFKNRVRKLLEQGVG